MWKELISPTDQPIESFPVEIPNGHFATIKATNLTTGEACTIKCMGETVYLSDGSPAEVGDGTGNPRQVQGPTEITVEKPLTANFVGVYVRV